MGKKSTIEDIVEEERSTFDLTSRLQGISKRERTVTVYTDEIAGEELGGIERFYYPDTDIVKSTRRWGVRGEQDALREKITEALKADQISDEEVGRLKAENAELEAKAAKIQKQLDKTAITFTLRAVPNIVLKDAQRKARQNLGIKIKGGITPEQVEDLTDEAFAVVLNVSVVSWIDAADGTLRHSLPLEDARALKKYLLAEEWAKIERAIDELQSFKAIGDRVTADADF